MFQRRTEWKGMVMSEKPTERFEPAKAEAGVRESAQPGDRDAMIARLAYLRAEQRGFAPGGELQDWLDAEAEVDAARIALKRLAEAA